LFNRTLGISFPAYLARRRIRSIAPCFGVATSHAPKRPGRRRRAIAAARSQGRQLVAIRRASQTSRIRSARRRVMRSVHSATRMGVTLSRLRAHSAGIPSEVSSATSVGIPRTTRVAGTASTWLRTGRASSRVRIRNGRRPARGCSYHHTSPRPTKVRGQRRVPPRPAGEAGHRRRCRSPRIGHPIRRELLAECVRSRR
jgi:hypothetical protein